MPEETRSQGIGRWIDVRPGEGRALVYAFAYFFFLLASYFILRPVRDEMAVRSGHGFAVELEAADHAGLFAESPSRVLLCVPEEQVGTVTEAARAASLPLAVLGRAGGDRLVVTDLIDVSLAEAIAASTGRIRDALASGTTH